MYAKLFSRIAQSSLMEEKVTTRYVFMMMLALSDRNGDVIGTDVAIARMMNVSTDEFKSAIEPLLSPDPDSNSQAEEGRRLVPSENGRGYKIVNYLCYRDMKSEEEKREYMRNYMRARRSKGDVKSVKPGKNELGDVTHTEAEADSEAEAEKKIPPIPQGGISRPKRKKSNPKHERVTENTPAMIQINDWFGRRPDTLWTVEQANILAKINPTEAVLNGMGNFYLAEEKPDAPLYRRTTLTTLLNNWDDELDKARAYARKCSQPQPAPKPKFQAYSEDEHEILLSDMP